jgi:hypothetical protein
MFEINHEEPEEFAKKIAEGADNDLIEYGPKDAFPVFAGLQHSRRRSGFGSSYFHGVSFGIRF